jgi:alkylation response protein AidB-like acyl-CoA dehydrogenase
VNSLTKDLRRLNVSTLDLIFTIARAVFLVFSFALAAVAFTRWRQAIRALTEQAAAQHSVVLQRIADLEARVDATNVSISKLGERVDRPQQLASPTTAASPGYQIAIRLAKGGASREELISGCGLSLNEAELVQRLHAPQTRSSARKSGAQRPHAA